jgi:hypothetical protein
LLKTAKQISALLLFRTDKSNIADALAWRFS